MDPQEALEIVRAFAGESPRCLIDDSKKKLDEALNVLGNCVYFVEHSRFRRPPIYIDPTSGSDEPGKPVSTP